MMLFAKHDLYDNVLTVLLKYINLFSCSFSVDGMHLKTEHGWVSIILLYCSIFAKVIAVS